MIGDGRAEQFTALYQVSRSRVLAYALRRTFSPEDAADVVAETFAIAWRRLDAIPVGEATVLWLYATARRVIANRNRRELHRSKIIERIGDNLAISIDLASGADDGEAIEASAALARLSDDDRELLMLAGWEGLDSAQLACVLGCSSTAARIRLHHARSRLNDELADLGVWTKQRRSSRQSLQQKTSLEATEEV